jgi:hypothetical protein
MARVPNEARFVVRFVSVSDTGHVYERPRPGRAPERLSTGLSPWFHGLGYKVGTHSCAFCFRV